MDYLTQLGALKENWKKSLSTLDPKGLKHIAGKEGWRGKLLGCLTASYYQREKLIRGGDLIYGYAFKSFQSDADEGKSQRPVWILFSPDARFNSDPEAYLAVADRLQELANGTQPKEAKLRKLYFILNNPYSDASYLEIPADYAGGRLCYLSIIYQRDSLFPFFHLGLNILIASRGLSSEVLFLPPEYWTPEWTSFYQKKEK